MKIEYRRINHITIAAPAGEHEKVRAFYGGLIASAFICWIPSETTSR